MALLDRIATPDGETVLRMPLEPFFGVMMEVHDGAITRAQAGPVLAASPFGLDASELAEADSWLQVMEEKPTAIEKMAFIMRSRMLCAALEQGVQGVSASYVKTRLGF